MAKIYYDGDADLAILKDQTIGILGYGNQGQAQAQNIRDSGLKVIIGNIDDEYKASAVRDGFEVFSIDKATESADVILMLIPDEVQPTVYQEQIKPHLKAGNVLCFASGYNIYYKRIVPESKVDTIMVAPRMIGQAVRNFYKQGLGFPCLLAKTQGSSENAFKIALAIAKAIGATRLGAFESSFEEETQIDLFAEQMLWPGIIGLCLLYFEKLVENGCDPEIVTTELYLSGEMVEIARAMICEGFFNQLRLHSHTSQYGQLSRAGRMVPKALLEVADTIMAEVRSGDFAEEWTREQEKGLSTLERLWEKALAHPMCRSEKTLEQLRRTIASWMCA